MVQKGEETVILDVSKIIYIESVERKTFVYTKDTYYESKLKLYEMKECLCECGFFRISKSCLVHLCYVHSMKNDVNRKLRLTLENGEQIIESRQYADEIKRRFGGNIMRIREKILVIAEEIIKVFGFTILCMALICVFFGEEAKGYSSFFSFGKDGLSISTIFQFLLTSVFIVVLRLLFLTDGLIKRMSIAVRLIGMFGL